ncbi:MAG: class I SAM-dependent methyltransferase [Planctomycetota bacterium]|nr:class I SAM-dependent methyltransferase [Planctomycetota bacterium]
MTDSSSEKFLEPYRQALRRFGPTFKAMLWGSRETQLLRFDVMIELAGFADCVILDAGCGKGDFAAHLLQRGVPFERFVGMDALDEMIETASARRLERCTFRTRDVLAEPNAMAEARADFICFSGTLNTMDESSARGLVAGAYRAAAQGVVFNFLSDRVHPRWADRDLGPARRFDTVAWLDWSLELSTRVSFTQDYLDGHDATILIRHE